MTLDARFDAILGEQQFELNVESVQNMVELYFFFIVNSIQGQKPSQGRSLLNESVVRALGRRKDM